MFNIGLRKVGGIWFWNVGRIGGTFHIQSRSSFARKQLKAQEKRTDYLVFTALDRAMKQLTA
jgi:hypothetical protein